MPVMVTNGGFESSSTLLGWTSSGSVSITTFFAHEGSQAALMRATVGSAASLTQSGITISATSTYLFGFSLAGPLVPVWGQAFLLTGNWSTATTPLSAFTVGIPQMTLAPQTAYGYYNTVQTAPSGATSLSINFALTTSLIPATVQLDDVSVVQVLPY